MNETKTKAIVFSAKRDKPVHPPLTLRSTQESSFKRDTLFVPFKAPVTTLAPSICELSNKLLSDSEHPSQTTSAYSKDERTKDLNKISSV